PWIKVDPGKGGTDYFRAQFFIIKIEEKDGKINKKYVPLVNQNVKVEVATAESERDIFYKVKEVTDSNGFIYIRIPNQGMVQQNKEKAMKHVLSFQDIIRYDLEILKKEFKDYPLLKKFIVSVWIHYGLSDLPIDIERNLWEVLKYLGINGIDRWDLGWKNFKELYDKYNILSTTDILWPYVKLDWNDKESIEDTISRVMDEYYKQKSIRFKEARDKGNLDILDFVPKIFGNVQDEPGAAINADRINKNEIILNDFREFLKKKNLTPEFFGLKDWNEVMALDNRKEIQNRDLYKCRLFYWTHEYIQHFTSIYWKEVTKAVHKYFKVDGVGPNFQAGPCRGGFLGNDNCVGALGCTLDFHKLYREGTFSGIKLEDWTYGWDFGIGKIDFGMAVLRSATRGKDMPRKFLLVGGEYIPGKAFAAIMNGVKEIQLYLYGPIAQIGPTWANVDYALKETGDLTRLIAKLEDEVYKAKNPETKIALLVTCTTDAMGALGYYFLTDRQALYTALRHSYFPVDLISEYDILEDNILENYKVLYIVDPNIRKKTLQKILNWIKEKGGFLVTQIGSIMYDEYNQSNLLILEELYGVKGLELIMGEKGIDTSKNVLDKISIIKEDFFKPQDKINVYGCKIKVDEIKTGEIIGVYEDGSPAVILNNYGKGKVLFCGTRLGWTYFNHHYIYSDGGKKLEHMRFFYPKDARRLITEMIYKAGVKNDWEFSIPGLYSNLMDIPNGKLLFVIDGFIMRPAPKDYEEILSNVDCYLRIDKNIKKIVSARFGELKFKKEQDVIKFTHNVLKPDIIAIYFE
ncbi:MAG: beta-galactosidase trimerization domain-containing protein, partial [Thermoplasmata archaeon]